jgi:hypothetical protein
MEAGTWAEHLIAPDRALAAYPALHLDAEGTVAVLSGRAVVAPPGTAGHSLARAYDADGRFIAVLERRGPSWKPHKVFAGAGGDE